MKPYRLFRSFGAAVVCFAMILCNIPLVMAQQNITISAPPRIDHDVCGNGTGTNGFCDIAAPIPNPASGNTLTINGEAIIGTRDDARRVFGGVAMDNTDASSNTVTVGDYAIINNDDEYAVAGGASINGSADGNTVTITGSATILNSVIGGWAIENIYSNAAVTNNTVNIEGGATIGGDVTGGLLGDDSIAGTGNIINGNNVVNVRGGTIRANVYGTSTVRGNIIGNKGVNISGGTIHGNVYDGYTKAANVEENEVNISGGTVNGEIFAGWTELGNAKGNIVNITGGTITDVTAGHTNTGISSNNKVNITGGASNTGIINGTVTAGFSDAGEVSNNSVIINFNGAAGVNGRIEGGRSGTGNVVNNTVKLENGTVNVISGGYTTFGMITGNAVTVTGGNAKEVYGGETSIGDNRNNSVTINGATANIGTVIGGSSELGNATENKVTIENVAKIDYVAGGMGTLDATGNAVIINGGIMTGGYFIGGTSSGTATGNTVTVAGGSGLAARFAGGQSGSGDARNNKVIISGGSATEVVGGRSVKGIASGNIVTIESQSTGTFGNIYGGYSEENSVSNNTVELFGGRHTGQIYGGFSESWRATNNTVTIAGNATFTTQVMLLGGHSKFNEDARTGNTLNLKKPITVGAIDNFQKYNFYLPANFAANDSMLTVTNGGNGKAIDLYDVSVDISVNRDSGLKQGDSIVLIDEQSGLGFNGEPLTKTSNGSTIEDGSGLLEYSFDISVEDDQLKAYLAGVTLSEESNSIPDGFLNGLILANQGADAIAGPAMDSAMTAAHKGPIDGLGAFGSLVVGKSKYEIGSNVDLFGITAAAGLAIGVDFAKSSLTMGPFFEYGKGDYDTSNTIGGDQEIKGEGDSEYMGGGFLLRMDYKDGGLGRYFAEASVRVGQQENNFSMNMPNGTGATEKISYKSDSPYYGFHLGYGGSWDVASRAGLDIYGKYFMARVKSSEVPMPGGDTINFDNLTSSRIRGGSRLAVMLSDRLSASFGGAYEYEMSGETKASMLNYSLGDASSLKGGTGIGEIVIGIKPSEKSRTSLNFAVQGYSGKRQGVTASLFLRF